MPEPRFAWRDAIPVLDKAGLLNGVLFAQDGRLRAAADRADCGGGFLGATLDSRAVQAGELFVALAGQRVDGRDFAPAVLQHGGGVLADLDPKHWQDRPAADGAVVLASPDPVTALAELARHWKEARCPRTVGITGTNGKTTTKDLTAALLRGAGDVLATSGNLNNHLGVPLTLLSLRERHEFAVIEMGASAVGEIRRLAALTQPSVGVITNASPAHLAEFGSLEGIIEGKGEMVASLPADGAAILNADSPGFQAWRTRATAPVVSFGREAGDHRWRLADRPQRRTSGSVLELDGRSSGRCLCPASTTPPTWRPRFWPPGPWAFRTRSCEDGLAGFRGSDHRGVLLELGGRRILDDCYNANPVSMVAAARALVSLPGTGRAIAALGHMAELGPDSDVLHHRTGVEQLAEAGIGSARGRGAGGRTAGRGLRSAGRARPFLARTLDEAADWLARHSRGGDRILVKGSRSAGLEKLLDRLRNTSRRGTGRLIDVLSSAVSAEFGLDHLQRVPVHHVPGLVRRGDGPADQLHLRWLDHPQAAGDADRRDHRQPTARSITSRRPAPRPWAACWC